MRAIHKERISPRASGVFAAVSSLVLAACAEAPPPVISAPKTAPVVPQAPAVTAPISEHPVFSLVEDSLSAPDCPAVPDQKWAPLVFEPFPLPPGTQAIRSVVGHNERDVWLLAANGQVPNKLLHWDGVSLQEEPIHSCQVSLNYGEFALGPSGLLIVAERLTETETYYEVMRRSASGSWVCDDQDNDARLVLVGESELRLPIWKSHVHLDGRSIPMPFPGAFGFDYPDAVGAGAEDFWVYAHNSSKVVHWNGVGWEAPMTGPIGVERMAMDRQGDIWLVGYGGGKGIVLRRSRDARSWACLPVPSLPRTQIFRVGSANDIWLIGSSQTYHWNGTVFHAGPTPVRHPSAAWLDADGTLWITGETSDYKGVVFRSRQGEKP